MPLNIYHFFTIPTLAALSTLSPIFQPVCITSDTVLGSLVGSGIAKTASWTFGSNFSPLGLNYTT